MAVSGDVCWCGHVKQSHWEVGGCKNPGCGCQEYAPKDGPTAEERAAFKRSEREAAAAIMAGDRYCPDPSVHEAAGRAVQDDGLDPARQACIDIMLMTVDHLDDRRLRLIHKAASRGVAPPLHDPGPDRPDDDAVPGSVILNDVRRRVQR